MNSRLSSSILMRIGTWAGALLTTLALAATAAAAAEQVTVVVACPELAVEELAHVEAMVRADLSTRSQAVRRVRFECRADWVTAEFDFGGGRIVSHGEPRASSRAHTAEQLIALSDRLLSIDYTGDTEEPVGTESLAVRAEGEHAPLTEGSPPETTRNGGSGLGVAPPGVTAATNSSLLRWTASVPKGKIGLHGTLQFGRTRRRLIGLELLAGTEFVSLVPNPWGMLGPVMGMAYVLREQLAFNVQGAIGWTLQQPSDIVLRDHRVAFGIEWRERTRFSLGVKLLLSALHASAPVSLSPSSGWFKLEPACQVDLGYRWEFGFGHVSLHPTITAYAHARTMRVDSHPMFDIPAILVGVVVQSALTF